MSHAIRSAKSQESHGRSVDFGDLTLEIANFETHFGIAIEVRNEAQSHGLGDAQQLMIPKSTLVSKLEKCFELGDEGKLKELFAKYVG